jgi:hypothetical protein
VAGYPPATIKSYQKFIIEVDMKKIILILCILIAVSGCQSVKAETEMDVINKSNVDPKNKTCLVVTDIGESILEAKKNGTSYNEVINSCSLAFPTNKKLFGTICMMLSERIFIGNEFTGETGIADIYLECTKILDGKDIGI